MSNESKRIQAQGGRGGTGRGGGIIEERATTEIELFKQTYYPEGQKHSDYTATIKKARNGFGAGRTFQLMPDFKDMHLKDDAPELKPTNKKANVPLFDQITTSIY